MHSVFRIEKKFSAIALPFCILLRLACPLYKIVVSTPGYFKKLTHNRYWILAAMTMDNSILYFGPHFLSMDCRKSRNSLFSILKRSSSFCVSCLGGWLSFFLSVGVPLVVALSLWLYSAVHDYAGMTNLAFFIA